MPDLVRSDSIDSHRSYLTSLSSNTPEIIAHDIRTHFAEHPATGLHKAELYIYSLTQSIRTSIESITLDQLKINAFVRDLIRLRGFDRCRLGWLYRILTGKYLDLEIQVLESKIRSGQMAIRDAEPLLEDAHLELETATSERDKILEHSPQLNTSKAEVMATFGRERLIAKLERTNRETMAANSLDASVRSHLLLDKPDG